MEVELAHGGAVGPRRPLRREAARDAVNGGTAASGRMRFRLAAGSGDGRATKGRDGDRRVVDDPVHDHLGDVEIDRHGVRRDLRDRPRELLLTGEPLGARTDPHPVLPHIASSPLGRLPARNGTQDRAGTYRGAVARLLASGLLPVTARDRVHWEQSGSRDAPPVLWLHGGPGSGLRPGYADALGGDLRVIGLDQRGCGRSSPLASAPDADLDANTTPALVADLERLREHLQVDGWLVCGISWGTTLTLAYAQAHPHRVRGIVLGAVTTTSTREVEWITEGLARVFPQQWEAFAGAVPRRSGERVVDAYARAMRDPALKTDAARAWCAWEDVHVSLAPGARPDPRFRDPDVRLLLATLVTHYWSNSGFGGDELLGGMAVLAGVPGVLVHGRADISSPLETPWRLHRSWPGSELVVLPEGHGGPATTAAIKEAVHRLAHRGSDSR